MWFNFRQNLYYFLSDSKADLDFYYFSDGKIVLSKLLEYEIITSLKKDFIFYKRYEGEFKSELEDQFLFKAFFVKRYYFPFFIKSEPFKRVVKSRDLFNDNYRFLNLSIYYYFYKNFFYYYSSLPGTVFEVDFTWFNFRKFFKKRVGLVSTSIFLKKNSRKEYFKNFLRMNVYKIFLKKKKIQRKTYVPLVSILPNDATILYFERQKNLLKRFYKKSLRVYNRLKFPPLSSRYLRVLKKARLKINSKLLFAFLQNYKFVFSFRTKKIRFLKKGVNLFRLKKLKKVLKRNLTQKAVVLKLLSKIRDKRTSRTRKKYLNVTRKIEFSVNRLMKKYKRQIFKRSKVKNLTFKLNKSNLFPKKLKFFRKFFIYSFH